MTGSRFAGLILFILLVVSTAFAQPQPHSSAPVSMTPAIVQAGSPELIRVQAQDATAVDGEWMGRKLEFFRGSNHSDWIALAGVDVESAAGPSTLRMVVHLATGRTRDLSQEVEIHPAHYRTGVLSVPPRFIEPGPEEQKQITADSELKAKAFANSAQQPLWAGSFHAPVNAPPTDSFGTRRTFNGKLASIHKGMDFRAPMGTLVRAANSGVVVLARPLYFEGNCVIIDHGLGLYTVSMHFSRIDVREGQQVKTGDRLGLSGASGRVTGPHLHWAVRWQGASLDPAKLLQLNLNRIR